MSDSSTKRSIATYTRMADGTKEDYLLLQEHSKPLLNQVADRALTLLVGLQESYPGNLIDRYQHSLQTATRAFRDEAEEEVVVAALLHDIGDLLAPVNHAELAAAILKPYVSPATHWIIEHHGIFQGYYFWHHTGRDRYAREKFRGHPYFDCTVEFCHKWDQESFDPNYDTLPLNFFEPMVRRIFARQPWGEHTKQES
ncbi:MAG: HD domain-containing protein [Nostoc sp. ChiQUE02]|uniref:HD domain-containing protein n=1 Tax=Nostoc sp. ChiQUE02 TaxID=3075377 RepID=UPI002AD307EF|nr:HD domain-containing protein [Nostoc sp. ChiQUE02]MDZ8228851.1 HD domain-containing protein [Nostoc sp. ChiQUE02]